MNESMKTGSLLQQIPDALPAEMFDRLVDSAHVRIERIVSRGHRSPPGFWYEQTENEWVLVMQGEARLRFEAGDKLVHLTGGMYIDIPAGARHRVEWTSSEIDTVWLAVFYWRLPAAAPEFLHHKPVGRLHALPAACPA